ncbi:BRCT domain protein, partial [mine drainage metagenome]
GHGAGGPGGSVARTLAGMSVVVSGTLQEYTREEAEAAVTSRGGRSPGSVSRRTDALVVGEAPGASKVQKAEELEVPILDEAAFVTLLATGTLPGRPAGTRPTVHRSGHSGR